MDRKTVEQNNSIPMLRGHLTEKTHNIKKMHFTERLHIEISVVLNQQLQLNFLVSSEGKSLIQVQ